MAKIALLIGVSEYQSGFKPLVSAAKDIDAMKRVLQHPEIGEFAPANITLLLNQKRQDIEEAIYHLFANRHKDDLLLFYFSGHGVTDSRGKLYLTTPTTCKDSQRGRLVKPTAVAASFIHECMNDSASQRQIVILDCCFSGAFAKGMTAKDDGTVNIKAQLGGKGRVILTSSNSIEYSFQEKESELSIYTRYLVEGIETGVADYDNDGSISADELHEYASSKVKEASPAMTPQFYPVEEGYRIKLAKAPVVDSKLKYRKEVEKILHEEEGEIDLINRVVLDELANQLGLTQNEVATIEAEVIEPYQQRQDKLQRYEQVFSEVIQRYYPLREKEHTKLKRLQQVLKLRDEDVKPIERRIASRHKQSFVPEIKQTKVPQKSVPPLPSPSLPLTRQPDIEVLSERGVDYTRLQELLAAKKWKEADEETARVMIIAAGQEKKGYLLGEDIKRFPCTDLLIIDQLWAKYSAGHFGFSVQKHIWESVGGRLEQYDDEMSKKFGDRVGWYVNDSDRWLLWNELTFTLNSSPGHLPGVCLKIRRGTVGMALLSRLETCGISDVKPILSISLKSKHKVELCSERGVDYSRLRDLLTAKKWKEADRETGSLMLQASGKDDKSYLNPSDIAKFPCTDLSTINQLWLHYSNGRFGLTVQKRIYEEVRLDYPKFCDRIGWRVGENWVSYTALNWNNDAAITAPEGHLPVDISASWKPGPTAILETKMVTLFSRLETCNILMIKITG